MTLLDQQEEEQPSMKDLNLHFRASSSIPLPLSILQQS